VLDSFLSRSITGDGKKFVFFTGKEQAFVREVVDIIIPKTTTKSASEVGVHFFLDQVFATCLTDYQKAVIK